MGVNRSEVAFLECARRLGADFARTLTIGNQNLFASAEQIRRGFADAGGFCSESAAAALSQDGCGYANKLFEQLGARTVDQIDASAYEGASIVHDLNSPLPSQLHDRFTVVFDGGSLEHIFNYPQALKNCMEAVSLGGHFITVTPALSQMGHGFYQISPELLYRALSPDNGFRVLAVLLGPTHGLSSWRRVANPELTNGRVTMTGAWPTLMYAVAERIAKIEPFREWPQQSDYLSEWRGEMRRVGRRDRALEVLPPPARKVARVLTTLAGTTSGPEHFERIKLPDLTHAEAQ